MLVDSVFVGKHAAAWSWIASLLASMQQHSKGRRIASLLASMQQHVGKHTLYSVMCAPLVFYPLTNNTNVS